MQQYTIRIPGARTLDGHLTGRVLGDLMHALAHGSAGSLLLRAEGRSKSRDDRLPEWVERGTSFALVKQLEGEDAGVVLLAPSLRDAIPERFEQADLFGTIDPSQSSLALLASSLEEASVGNADSEAFDADLLGIFKRDLTRLFRRNHVEELTIQNGVTGAPIRRFDMGTLKTVDSLRERTPRPRRVRVAGRLDEARYSRCAFVLAVDDGSRVRGVLVESRPEQLKPYFGEMVVVEGVAQFRPSGRLLRIDVDQLAPASNADLSIFSNEPVPMEARVNARDVRRSQKGSTGVAALFGQWPGTESDETIDSLVREVS